MKDLELRGVSKRYGGQVVLADWSARVPAGGVAALMGPSGEGKTTVARLLLGLEAPDGGEVFTGGAQFSCQFQEDRLCPGLSAVGNVALVLPRARRGDAQPALEALGLSGEDLAKPVRQLSGGQRRRVALARAMEADGEAVVLDEPFKGLDEVTRGAAVRYILDRRRGRTLLLVTHDEADAEALGAVVLRV